MRFRLTDERNWAHEFAAMSASELSDGVRVAWYAFIAAGWPGQESAARVLRQVPWALEALSAHPAVAYRAIESRIAQWLTSRLAGPGDHRSWEAQAALWRHHAGALLGESAGLLRLHVGSETAQEWLALDIGLSALPSEERGVVSARVARQLDSDAAAVLFRGAEIVVMHDRDLASLAGHVSEAVRRVQYPPLRLAASPRISRG